MNNKLKDIFGPNFNLADIDFAAPPSSLSILNIDSLDSDVLFKALKSELELFFLERKRSIERQTLHKGKSSEWKEHFYHSLQMLLNEVIFTASFRMKQVLLKKIYNWYKNKANSSPIPEQKKYFQESADEKEDLEIYIPQKIESTVPIKKYKLCPHIPSTIHYPSEANNSKQSLFKALLRNENEENSQILPKVKSPRNRDNFIRPFSPFKGISNESSPIIKDFRSHSRARSTALSRGYSPETFKNTAYQTPFLSDSTVNSEFTAIPNLRRIQIKEVMKIKKRFASKRIFCPVKVLEGGLVISDYTLDPIPPENFPKGGELLMQEPYDNQPSTKKKRKKGKKKS